MFKEGDLVKVNRSWCMRYAGLWYTDEVYTILGPYYGTNNAWKVTCDSNRPNNYGYVEESYLQLVEAASRLPDWF